MRHWTRALAVGTALSCGSPPEPEPAQVLHTHRLSVEFPESWTVESEPGRNEGLFMGLHEFSGAASARVFLRAYDAQAPFAPADVASMHMDSLQGISQRTEGAATQASVGGAQATGVEVRFAQTSSGAPVPHTLQVFTQQSAARTATIIVQVADRDLAREQAGITLLLDSFRLF